MVPTTPQHTGQRTTDLVLPVSRQPWSTASAASADPALLHLLQQAPSSSSSNCPSGAHQHSPMFLVIGTATAL